MRKKTLTALNISKRYIRVGCDLDIDICLQRCITEIFQGFDFDVTFRMQMNSFYECEENWWKIPVDVKKGLVKSLFDGTGRLPAYMLDTKTYKSGELLPFEGNLNNSECLERLVGLLRKQVDKAYMMCYNYIGVPTVRIYVPGLSEAFLYDYPMLGLWESLCNLKHFNENGTSQEELYKDISNILNYPTYSNSANVSKICGILYDDSQNCELGEMHYLYACIALHMGEYETAKKYYKHTYSVCYGMKAKWYIDNVSCIIDAIEYGISAEQVKVVLCNKEDDSTLQGLIEKMYGYRKFGVRGMGCQDCTSCLFADGCLYTKWNALYTKYSKAKHLKLDDFLEFFKKITDFWGGIRCLKD